MTRKTYNTYICVSMTKYRDYPICDTGYSYVRVASCNLTMSHRLTYQEGKRQLARLALKMGKLPEVKPNPYDPTIVTYELSGFLE